MADPTAVADSIADKMREYYEANRETWWYRFRRRTDTADDLMLGLMQVYNREIKEWAERDIARRKADT
jgi:hypothetical protein